MASTFAIFSHNHKGWYNKATEKFESARTEDCEFVEPHVAHHEANKLLERLGLSTQLSVEISTTVSPSDIAARTRPNPVLHIREEHVTPTESRISSYTAEASELFWAPGFFPLELTTSLGNTLDLVRVHLDECGARYNQLGGCISLTVYND